MNAASKKNSHDGRAIADDGRPPLCEFVRDSLDDYFGALNGHEPSDLYEFVVAEVEQPLFQVVMHRTGGNITRAAQILGMNRGTLRKKLRKYGLS